MSYSSGGRMSEISVTSRFWFWCAPASRLQTANFLLYFHMVEGGKNAPWSLFVRALIPLMGTPPI